MDQPTILNVKVTKEYKEAVRKAAFHAGYVNTSQFLLALLNKNPYVINELKKSKKKVA